MGYDTDYIKLRQDSNWDSLHGEANHPGGEAEEVLQWGKSEKEFCNLFWFLIARLDFLFPVTSREELMLEDMRIPKHQDKKLPRGFDRGEIAIRLTEPASRWVSEVWQIILSDRSRSSTSWPRVRTLMIPTLPYPSSIQSREECSVMKEL